MDNSVKIKAIYQYQQCCGIDLEQPLDIVKYLESLRKRFKVFVMFLSGIGSML